MIIRDVREKGKETDLLKCIKNGKEESSSFLQSLTIQSPLLQYPLRLSFYCPVSMVSHVLVVSGVVRYYSTQCKPENRKTPITAKQR